LFDFNLGARYTTAVYDYLLVTMPTSVVGHESDEELQARVLRGPLPRHVAIIMDGNGRWASARHLPRVAGHREGIKSVRETVTACRELGIAGLTIYAFSAENWRRPAFEVRELMMLLELYLQRELSTLLEKDIRFRTIGRIERLPATVVDWIRRVERETAGGREMTLTLALSYSGRSEIVDAARRMAEDARSGALDPSAIDEDVLSRYLDTRDFEDPDLVIRTSGECRISNFLLWQIAYAELYFTKTLWPDFRRRDLLTALLDYQRRERRFGRTGEQLQGSPG
jgi:undecaprenyl diphosphate synthase